MKKYIHLLTKEEFEKEKQYNLTEEQFALLEVIDYAEAKRKAQSIARFMKKEIINNNGAISISFAKLCKKYNDWVNSRKRYRKELKNIKLTQFKFTVNRLEELGLLIISKNKNKNLYTLAPTEKTPISENITPPEIPSLDSNSETARSLGDDNIDIDSYSNSKQEKQFNSNMYEKCTSLVDVRIKVKELLKFKRVKSNWIKDKVLISITKNYRNITKKFLDSYILTAISNIQEQCKRNWLKYRRNQNLTQHNFTQREYSKAEIKEIENILTNNAFNISFD